MNRDQYEEICVRDEQGGPTQNDERGRAEQKPISKVKRDLAEPHGNQIMLEKMRNSRAEHLCRME